jgi:sugar/nucleoside kinase (ribokinase family)
VGAVNARGAAVESTSDGVPFLVVGHVTRDHVGNDVRCGGTASYAAGVAAGLGVRSTILTSAADDLTLPPALRDVTVVRQPARETTVFEHRWFGRRREQYLKSRAETIDPAAADVVPLAAAPVVLFGPVTGEVEPALLHAFPRALRGGAVQGWLRWFDADGHMVEIDPRGWRSEEVFAALDAVFLSEEDLGIEPDAAAGVLETWARQVRILTVTLGERGARIAVEGRWHHVGAVPAQEVDATGAGDAFAAGFLIRYHETADVQEAARFAAAVASFVVEAPGLDGVPTRCAVEARLAAHPDVRLKRE